MKSLSLVLVAPAVFLGACALGGNDADPALEQESGSTRYVEISELEGGPSDARALADALVPLLFAD